MIRYVAKRGEALSDGDTVGRTANEKLRARYQPSPADPTVEMWRVDLP